MLYGCIEDGVGKTVALVCMQNYNTETIPFITFRVLNFYQLNI